MYIDPGVFGLIAQIAFTGFLGVVSALLFIPRKIGSLFRKPPPEQKREP